MAQGDGFLRGGNNGGNLSNYSQTKRNWLSLLAAPAGVSVIAFVTIPIFLRRLGLGGFGIWTTATALSGAVSILNVAFGDAQAKHTSERLARGDLHGLRAVTSSALALASVWGVFWLLVGGLVVAPHAGLFGVSAREMATAATVIRAAFMIFALTLLQNVAISGLRGLHRSDLASLVTFASEALRNLFAVGAVLLGRDVVLFAYGNLVGVALGTLVAVASLRRAAPALQLRPHFDRTSTKGLVSFGFFVGLAAITGLVKSSLPVLVISRFFGPAAGPLYAIPQQASQRISGIFGNVTTVMLPMFSTFSQSYSKQASRVRELADSAVRATVVPAILVLGGGFAVARAFLGVWVSPSFGIAASPVLQWLLVEAAIVLACAVAAYALSGLGEVRFIAAVAGANALLLVCLLPVGLHYWGVTGIAMAVAAASTTVLVLPYRLLRKLQVVDSVGALGRLYGPAVLSVAVASLVLWRFLPRATTWPAVVEQAGCFFAIAGAGVLLLDWSSYRSILHRRRAIFGL